MSEPTIDLLTFRQLEETAGAPFVAELVDTFLAEAPAMFASLRAALAATDVDGFRRAAHSLKSNGLTFGALALGGLARDLELRAAEVEPVAAAAAIDALEVAYQQAAVALQELRHG